MGKGEKAKGSEFIRVTGKRGGERRGGGVEEAEPGELSGARKFGTQKERREERCGPRRGERRGDDAP
jgi:hypothetical protein